MPFVEGENLAILEREARSPCREQLRSPSRSRRVSRGARSRRCPSRSEAGKHHDCRPTAGRRSWISDLPLGDHGNRTATAAGAVMGTLIHGPRTGSGPGGRSSGRYLFVRTAPLRHVDRPSTDRAARQRHVRDDEPDAACASVGSNARCASAGGAGSHRVEVLQSDAKARLLTTGELVADLEALAPDGHRLTPSHPVSASRTDGCGDSRGHRRGAGLGGWWIWHTGGGVPAVQQQPVSVLIANFENKADEPLFDGLIEQALGVGIEGASFVTAYSRREALRVASTINQGATLDEGTSRLVARREGIKRIVTGSIAADGSKYTLAVKILDPVDGKSLLYVRTRSQQQGRRAECRRTSCGKGASWTGRHDRKRGSGQGDRDIHRRFAAGGARVHQAQELQAAGKYPEAVEGYNKALELDPQLGRAYARSGCGSKPAESRRVNRLLQNRRWA